MLTQEQKQDLLTSLVGKIKKEVKVLCKRFDIKPFTCRENRRVYPTLYENCYDRVNVEYDDGFVTNVYIG